MIDDDPNASSEKERERVGRVVKPSAGFIDLVRLVVQASLALRPFFHFFYVTFLRVVQRSMRYG